MHPRSLRVGFALLALLALLPGCTAGTGAPKQLTGSTRDPAGTAEEPSGAGREPPGDTRDNDGGSGAACPPCDYVYACTASAGAESQSGQLTLITHNGACFFQGLTTTFD